MCIHASERDAALRGERARETGEAGAEAFKTSGAAGARLSPVLSLSLSASSVSVSLWPKARLALSLVFVPSLSLSPLLCSLSLPDDDVVSCAFGARTLSLSPSFRHSISRPYSTAAVRPFDQRTNNRDTHVVLARGQSTTTRKRNASARSIWRSLVMPGHHCRRRTRRRGRRRERANQRERERKKNGAATPRRELPLSLSLLHTLSLVPHRTAPSPYISLRLALSPARFRARTRFYAGRFYISLEASVYVACVSVCMSE